MSFIQFHEEQYFRIFRDNEHEIRGGRLSVGEGIELTDVFLTVFIRGALSGSERMRFNLYGNEFSSKPIVSSDWVNLSEIGDYADNWVGNLLFKINLFPLNPNGTYYMRTEIQNYTRNGEEHYIGVNLDWQDETSQPLDADTRGFRLRLVGLK